LAAFIVYGTPSTDLTQASWFRVEDKQAVREAAAAMKFSVIEIQTDADKAQAVGVQEGVLKGSGRMIVGSVTPEVYRRIEEYANKTSRAPAAKATNDAGAGPKASSEQKVNIDGKAAPSAPDANPLGTTAEAPRSVKPEVPLARDPWDGIRIGSHVIGKYWDDDGEPYGWWLGVIKDIDKNDFVIKWPDEPLKPALKIERKHVAILHPSYDTSREWERRR